MKTKRLFDITADLLNHINFWFKLRHTITEAMQIASREIAIDSKKPLVERTEHVYTDSVIVYAMAVNGHCFDLTINGNKILSFMPAGKLLLLKQFPYEETGVKVHPTSLIKYKTTGDATLHFLFDRHIPE